MNVNLGKSQNITKGKLRGIYRDPPRPVIGIMGTDAIVTPFFYDNLKTFAPIYKCISIMGVIKNQSELTKYGHEHQCPFFSLFINFINCLGFPFPLVS